jgi:hypothetical protein
MGLQKYHILNGDALKEQLPKTLVGEVIVMREALIEGPLACSNLDDFWKNRSRFMAETYGISQDEYQAKSIDEISKIAQIDPKSEVNLWFENDLFCQANMWFVIGEMLKSIGDRCTIHWVRPLTESWTGFGGMNEHELAQAYTLRTQLTVGDLNILHKLWEYYCSENIIELSRLAQALPKSLQSVKPSIEAQCQRFNSDGLSRPKQSILDIAKAEKTTDFGRIFKVFCETEGVYGFGDMQVKRLYDELIEEGLIK